jgi:hypothetical protein
MGWSDELALINHTELKDDSPKRKALSFVTANIPLQRKSAVTERRSKLTISIDSPTYSSHRDDNKAILLNAESSAKLQEMTGPPKSPLFRSSAKFSVTLDRSGFSKESQTNKLVDSDVVLLEDGTLSVHNMGGEELFMKVCEKVLCSKCDTEILNSPPLSGVNMSGMGEGGNTSSMGSSSLLPALGMRVISKVDEFLLVL